MHPARSGVAPEGRQAGAIRLRPDVLACLECYWQALSAAVTAAVMPDRENS